MENIKNLEEKKQYEKEKYIKYNSNENLKTWLLNKEFKCEICNKTMCYSSKYRHLKTQSHLKKDKPIKTYTSGC